MDFPSLFYSSQGFSHLNAGTQTRTPIFAIEAMERARKQEEVNPTEALYSSFPKFWALQKRVADFLGASPHDIFFRTNITTALNDFIFSIPLPSNGEIVVTSWEYGAISNIAQQRAKQSGMKFRILELNKNDSDLAEYIGASLNGVSLLVMSHVCTGNGEVLPIDRIAKIAKEKGVIVAVDGAHAVGAMPVNFSQLSNIDFYGGNFHKWFLGPKGTAFGWVHPKWSGKIPWNFGGWASFEVPPAYQEFSEGNHETARRFYSGTIDPIPYWGLDEVLSLWKKEEKFIRSQQIFLRDLLKEELCEKFHLITSPNNSPLIAFTLPKEWRGNNALALANKIYYEAKVQVAFPVVNGEMLLRLSPGVYISEEEARAGAKALKDFKL